MVVLEEIFINAPGMCGGEHPFVRADMVFFETPAGGAVFSTSSISWAGSLSHRNYENNVSRITGNVLDRFLDAKPF
jgi:N,N-dimethylformamidase